ncbi:hypothetical protein GPECTOR_42g756 [Gonium pectorale]|uniref:Uncharacterized protein n=1 Tax=Gonium pectorale TaxID=33097 RepID=A0A150G9M5_GONPE|nr:hypothetical protein GPECTOR_42g756 [Gonium pectorale]|eukprot:KXZ46549.1 hypothetical protein GPECTOR_42g756 [Gonium pectorale]
MSVLSVHSPVLAKRHFDEGEAGDGCERQFGGKRSRQHYSPAAARRVQFAAGGLHAVPTTTLSALLALFPGMDERDGTAAAAAEQSTPGPSVEQRPPAGTPEPQAGPTTAEQWVEVLVAEMSAATDMTDARQRAAGFLRQFEAFVARFVRQQQAVDAAAGTPGPSADPSVTPGPSATPGGAAGASAAASPLPPAARAAKLAEENAVLKKAVQIQHRQLQERAGQEAEVAQLKGLLAQYQEQIRTLQVSNYSLSLHLQKATNSGVISGPHNPDVF